MLSLFSIYFCLIIFFWKTLQTTTKLNYTFICTIP